MFGKLVRSVALTALGALCLAPAALADKAEVSPSEAIASLRDAMPQVIAPAPVARVPGGPILEPPALAPAAGQLAVTGAAGPAEVARDASDGFGIATPAGTLSVTPVGVDSTATDAKVVAGQSAVYANTDPAADTVVRPTPLGIETFTQIRDAAAPETYSWRANLPGHQRLRRLPDGGVAVVDGEGNTVASVSAPWAKDSNGTAVPVSFAVDGSTLTMTVAHRTGDYAYPIVADPFWRRARRFVKRHWYTRCLAGAGLGAIRGGWVGAGVGCVGGAYLGG